MSELKPRQDRVEESLRGMVAAGNWGRPAGFGGGVAYSLFSRASGFARGRW